MLFMPRIHFIAPTIARQVIVGLAIATCLACFGGSCDDSTTLTVQPPTIASVLPCAALPGEEVRISGSNLSGFMTIGGRPATVVSGGANNMIVRVATDAAGSSGLYMTGQNGSASYPFTVLTGVAKAEVEPNDDVNGADATDTNGERKGSGNLSTAADRDHFRIDCMDPAASYKIKVVPATFGPVYVNGVAVTLDANGEGALSSGTMVRFIGFTGHQGAYSFEVTKL